MFFDVLMFILGFMSVLRTLDMCDGVGVCSQSALTKIGTGLLGALFWIIFEWNVSSVSRAASVFAVIVFFIFVIWILVKMWEQQMQNQLHHFVQQMILNMKMGSSFRLALQLAAENQTSLHTKKWFGKIYENVVFTQHENIKKVSQMHLKVIRELKHIDHDSHQAISRLENMHAWLRTQSEFRRRSGKALLHVRVQAVVIGVLYIAVIIFMSHFVGFQFLQKFLPLSAGLMLLGLIIVLFQGRRMRWSF
jgi:Flp pilus assembly protein TadB